MWICACCGDEQDGQEMQCSRCGYDESRNTLRYPTLSRERSGTEIPAAYSGGDLTGEEMLALGNCYRDGRGLPQDSAAAAKWYRRAAAKGLPDARYWLGVCFQQGLGVPKRESRAAGLFRMAADQGHGPSMFRLGSCYEHGTGVAKDLNLALRWFRKAEAMGEPKAAYRVKTLEARLQPERTADGDYFYAPQMPENPLHTGGGWKPAPPELE